MIVFGSGAAKNTSEYFLTYDDFCPLPPPSRRLISAGAWSWPRFVPGKTELYPAPLMRAQGSRSGSLAPRMIRLSISAVMSIFFFLSEADWMLQRWVILSVLCAQLLFGLQWNYTKGLSGTFDCTFGQEIFQASEMQNACELHKAGATRLRSFTCCAALVGCLPAPCHSDSRTSIFCVWVVSLRLICDYFPLHFKAGLQCTTQSFGSAQTWITHIKNSKRQIWGKSRQKDISREVRKSDLMLPVEAIAVIV